MILQGIDSQQKQQPMLIVMDGTISLEKRKMPSTSAKQQKMMDAAAHDTEFAKRVGIPTSVAKEYYAADQRKKMAKKLRKNETNSN